jgi:hypothetical protein
MDLKPHLIDGDPLAREPELDALHAQAMRQRVTLEARNQAAAAASARWWLQPAAVAGALVACLAAGIAIGLRVNGVDPSPSVGRPAAGRQSPPPRQMQFASPGGTRIIWTFHQELDL